MEQKRSTKIYLPPDLDRALRHLAVERGTSFTALIQEAAERVVAEARERGELQGYR